MRKVEHFNSRLAVPIAIGKTAAAEYIHDNPVRAGLVKYAEEYIYSSARFYHDGVDEFKMITHYMGE